MKILELLGIGKYLENLATKKGLELETECRRTQYNEYQKYTLKQDAEIKKLQNRIFKLEHPAEFKIGDKIDRVWLVCEEPKMLILIETNTPKYWQYQVINPKTGEKRTVNRAITL